MIPGDSTVLFRAVPAPLKFIPEEKRSLKLFARTLSERLGGGRAWTCLITGDQELRRLNAAFLGHDYPTDVLSFPASLPEENLGELAISIERAHQQAAQFGHALLSEICILMLHGFLHLTGMDHERDCGEMARAETRWRAEFDLPSTLIARSKRRQ